MKLGSYWGQLPDRQNQTFCNVQRSATPSISRLFCALERLPPGPPSTNARPCQTGQVGCIVNSFFQIHDDQHILSKGLVSFHEKESRVWARSSGAWFHHVSLDSQQELTVIVEQYEYCAWWHREFSPALLRASAEKQLNHTRRSNDKNKSHQSLTSTWQSCRLLPVTFLNLVCSCILVYYIYVLLMKLYVLYYT